MCIEDSTTGIYPDYTNLCTHTSYLFEIYLVLVGKK